MPQDPQKTAPANDDPELQNEGEGSRSGARRYDAEVEKAARNTEHVDELARKAKEALEGAEGEELRKADERGKRADHK